MSSFVMLFTVAACGAFGSKDDTSNNSTPPPGTPEGNSQPPIPGAPLTGIFASSSKGADDGDGSMAKPYKTLAAAIALAQSSGQRVIACAEVFQEAVVVPDGVSMYGYYDCTQSPWTRANANAVVKSPTSPALLVKDAPHVMRIDGFDVNAPDLDAAPAMDDTKASSIAAWVSNAAMLTLGSVNLKAGNGAPGTNGVDGPSNQEQGSPNGVTAYRQGDCRTLYPSPPYAATFCTFRAKGTKSGPKGGTSKCGMGVSNGGAGGDGGMGAAYPDWDGVTPPDPCSTTTGPAGFVSQGGAATTTPTTAQGSSYTERKTSGLPAPTPGPDGAPGAEGGDGANGSWKLAADGFHPGSGVKGGDGQAGQGGGGSGGDYLYWAGGIDSCPSAGGGRSAFDTATGASGGAGGCPGFAGTPGGGGGASIGILIVNSGVAFEQGSVQSGTGGSAGEGTLGSGGLLGGTGGVSLPDTDGGTSYAGHGGAGGSGGASGHGAPGPSFAIAYTGNAPTVGNATMVMPGSAGTGQPGQQKTTNGKTHSLQLIMGMSQAEFQF